MRRLPLLMIAAGAAFLALGVPFARAIEEGRPIPQGYVLAQGWVITLYLDKPTADDRMEFEISGIYPKRSRCKDALNSIRIIAKGGRLRCDWVDELRPALVKEFP
jgi:hypothetical protein